MKATYACVRPFPPNPLTDGMAWSGFDRAASYRGDGGAAVFQAIGVPLSTIDQPGMSASFRQYVEYFEVAAQLHDDPDFGHKFGLRTRATQSGIPGHLILNANRFRDGIRDLIRTLPTLVEGLRPELVEDRNPPAVTWSIAPGMGRAVQFTLFCNAYMVRMFQAHRGRQWRPLRILYSVPAPVHAWLYARQLGCLLIFNAPINAIEIRREDLNAAKGDVDRHVHSLLTKYSEFLLSRKPSGRDFLDAVKDAVADGLTLSRGGLTFVAQRLRISRRALQRRIAARGTSLREIQQEVRFSLAQALLAQPELSVGEIASKLGYREISAFSRAFSRRFGISPRAARPSVGRAAA
jgi:AraC-like DNA-binding protein